MGSVAKQINANHMSADNTKLDVKFLKGLSRIKGWDYHSQLEYEKKDEIKKFIADYIFNNGYKGIPGDRISYNRLHFLVERPAFKPVFKAIIALLEACDDEKEFHEHYRKVNVDLSK